MSRLWALLPVLIFSAGLAWASSTSDKLALVAERSTPEGLQQFALVFDAIAARGAELSLNSNFLEEPGREALLGRFRADKDDEVLRAQRSILSSLRTRLERQEKFLAGSPLDPGPALGGAHETRFRISGVPVTEPSISSELMRIPAFVRRGVKWAPVDAVHVRLGDGGEITLEYLGTSSKPAGRPKRLESSDPKTCRKERHQLVCTIPGFGTAFLKP